MKICSRCKIAKPANYSFFGKNGDKLRASCKTCTSIMKREARISREKKDPLIAELRKEKARKYIAENKEKVIEYKSRWAIENQEKIKNNQHEYYINNIDTIKARASLWRINNLDKKRLTNKAWADSNRDKVLESYRKKREARKACPVKNMADRVSSLVSGSIRKKGYGKRSKTHEILGCDWHVFINHIERQFVKGMSWDRRSEFHIDHIVPLASAKTEDDVIALNHYTNLRPLWTADNLLKKDNMEFLI